MDTRQMLEELQFKEERISTWERFGCLLSKDGKICEFVYPEV